MNLNPMSLLRNLRVRAIDFVAAPASPRPLAVFRIGLSAVLLLQALALAGSLQQLYGRLGIVQWAAMDPTIAPGVPRLRWLADLLAPFGVNDVAVVNGVFLAYVGGLSCLLLGCRTRLAAVAAWLTHLILLNTAQASIYGVDTFAHVGLFFCIFMPVGHALSWDRMAGTVKDDPSAAARLSLRVLQIYLCIVYLSSGIEKATGEQWWNGEAIWRSVMRQDLGQFDFAWLASVPWLAKLLCWSTLLVEIGYAVVIWPRWTRRWWALATIGLHVGIGVSLGLVSFSCVMIVFTLSAFLISPRPREQDCVSATDDASVRPCAASDAVLNGQRVAVEAVRS